MTLLNFAHPLTDDQRAGVERLAGQALDIVLEVPVQFDHERSFVEQSAELVSAVSLASEQWQTEPIIVNLPSLNVIAALVMSEMHGRMGHFPSVLRLRPIVDSVPMRFEAAEILDLQKMRDRARTKR